MVGSIGRCDLKFSDSMKFIWEENLVTLLGKDDTDEEGLSRLEDDKKLQKNFLHN